MNPTREEPLFALALTKLTPSAIVPWHAKR